MRDFAWPESAGGECKELIELAAMLMALRAYDY